MSATIIDGNAIAEEIKQRVAREASALRDRGRTVRLVAVQVGENPASRIYTNMQAASCESVGIEYDLLHLPAEITRQELVERIEKLNAFEGASGVILQMPLPASIEPRAIQAAIDPRKDVEGVHPANLGRLFCHCGQVAPCTPLAVMELLRRHCADLGGREVVVVGHSEIVGKPIALMLLQSPNAAPTVTVCHVATRDLAAHTRRAEVLIVATGVAQARWMGYCRRRKAGQAVSPPDLSPLIQADMVADGALVVDVAINRIPKGLDAEGNALKNEKGKAAMVTVGDVDFGAVSRKASAITPVPGGVGPVTVAMLLKNTVACAAAGA